jgi:hypothetical protein
LDNKLLVRILRQADLELNRLVVNLLLLQELP